MGWFVKDACGIACAILAWTFLAFAQYSLLTIVLLPQQNTTKKYANIAIFEFFSFLAIVSHLRTIFTDPGSVPQRTATAELMNELESNSRPNQMIIYKCPECCSVKPDRAHHCSVCKRCIRKMDHHCPWVNNCVGERNQKYFVLFTLYVTIIATHALFLTVGHFLTCIDADWNSATNPACVIMARGRPSPGKLIMLVFLVFESLLFSMFTFIMFYIQMKAIWTDWTGIENLKKENRSRRSGFNSLKNVCGSHFLLWLSPFTKPPALDSHTTDYGEPKVDSYAEGVLNQHQDQSHLRNETPVWSGNNYDECRLPMDTTMPRFVQYNSNFPVDC